MSRSVFLRRLGFILLGAAGLAAFPAQAQQNQRDRSNFELIQPDYRQPQPYQPPNYPQPEKMPMPPVILPPQSAPPPVAVPPPVPPR